MLEKSKIPSRLSAGRKLLCVLILGIEALLLWNTNSQGSTFIYPFFSGAANLGLDFTWKIDVKKYFDFLQMSYADQLGYVFERGQSNDLIEYSILDRGYMFIVWIAQHLFFWLPQIKAVIWLQILFHIASSLWVMNRLSTRREQITFFLFYAANPIIIHFVTFAFYYYWQIIPPLAWYIYKEKKGVNNLTGLCFLAIALAAAFLIRQSTLIISLLILGSIAWQSRKLIPWAILFLFFIFAIACKNPSQPWHTAYVGIGAYSNNAGIELSDQSGYKRFLEQTGIQIEIDSPYGNIYNPDVQKLYYSNLKDGLLSYAKEHPWQMAKNAALNVLQSLSVGYPVGHEKLVYASALFGLIVFIVLVRTHLYSILALVLANVAGFVFYFPPIPAYMFGNYFLLTLALVIIVSRIEKFNVMTIFSRYRKKRLP
jgi:hypothetical protein